MKNQLHLGAFKNSLNRELIATLRSTLDRKYDRVLRDTHGEWEGKFGGKDPSDACVTVRISAEANGVERGSFAHDFRQAA